MGKTKKIVIKQTPKHSFKTSFTAAKKEAISGTFSPTIRSVWIHFSVFVYLLLVTALYRSMVPLVLLFILFVLSGMFYVRQTLDSTKETQSLFRLLQTKLFHDVAVLIGSVAGYISYFSKVTVRGIKTNRVLVGLIGIYVVLMVSVLGWGLPGNDHPFTYHMDEWHQIQAVRFTLTTGNPNQEGAAYGPLLQFLLSGIYLVPFTLLGIINPLLLSSSFSHLDMQMKIFEVLRTNTILFGIISLLGMSVIAKSYLRISGWLSAALFLFTPLFLSLSNYFKYDVALVGWLVLGLLATCYFAKKPTEYRYYLIGLLLGCALATKISALPAVLLYVFSYFLFIPKKSWQIVVPVKGVLFFLLIFCLLGIPNVFFGKGDYFEFLYSNLVTNPSESSNYHLGMPYQIYLITRQLPFLFGYGLVISSLVSFIYWSIRIVKDLFRKKSLIHKHAFFIMIGFLLFAFSLIPLKINGTGNRALVLLPFLVLLAVLVFREIQKRNPRLAVFLIGGVLCVQIVQCIPWMAMKWAEDPRETSSHWLVTHIAPQDTIGVENIPIYQYLPDISLKEFYRQQEKLPTRNYYQVVDANSPKFPNTVIISNADITEKYVHASVKKDLLHRLHKEGYKKVSEFSPQGVLVPQLISQRDFYMANLGATAPISEIAIYQKKK